MSSHFDQSAGMEINKFIVAAVNHFGYRLFIVISKYNQGTTHEFKFRSNLLSLIDTNLSQVSAGCNPANCSNNLQLGGSFINGSNTGIAVNTFNRVIFHKSGPSVNLNGIVSQLITEFARDTFTHWSEQIGQSLIFLHFSLFFFVQSTFLSNVSICFV